MVAHVEKTCTITRFDIRKNGSVLVKGSVGPGRDNDLKVTDNIVLMGEQIMLAPFGISLASGTLLNIA